MRDTEVSAYAICYSMEKEINEKVEKLKERIEKGKTKLNGPDKVGFFEKMSINNSIKNYEEEIKKLTELNQSLGNFRFSDTNTYSFPDNILEQFNDLSSILDEEETNELRNAVNNSLRNSNKNKKENVKIASTEVQKILNELGLSTKEFLIYDGLDYKKSMPHEASIKEVEKELLGRLTPKYTPVHSDKKEIELSPEDYTFFENFDKMLKNKEVEESNEVQKIVENLEQIKETMIIKEKCSKLLLKVSNVLLELDKITEIDVSEIKKFLSKLEITSKKELEKANKFLSKFDFTDIKKQIEEKKAKEEQEKSKNNNIVIYENLAYELEKTLIEEPDNHQKIYEIEAKMQEHANSYGLTKDEMDVAKQNGKQKYHNDTNMQKNKVDAIKETITYEDELRKGVMAQIREEAIRELERGKAFDESHELRNGDVHSAPMDKEAMIKRKMDELMLIAEMTPEERGLYELKKEGRVKPDATINDLSMQQLNDIRIGYSDNAYEFMADYKNWKSRESVKPKANEIFKEYIKYRAALEDKTNFLSFSEYAKQKHNIEQMSEIMVDQNLKEELAELSEGTSR